MRPTAISWWVPPCGPRMAASSPAAMWRTPPFTPTSCAERTALFKAVSEGVTSFTDIAVVGSRRGEVNKQITSPCGVCRQALFEFGGPELNVIMAKTPDDFIERSMDELLPFGFGPSNVAGNKAVEG